MYTTIGEVLEWAFGQTGEYTCPDKLTISPDESGKPSWLVKARRNGKFQPVDARRLPYRMPPMRLAERYGKLRFRVSANTEQEAFEAAEEMDQPPF